MHLSLFSIISFLVIHNPDIFSMRAISVVVNKLKSVFPVFIGFGFMWLCNWLLCPGNLCKKRIFTFYQRIFTFYQCIYLCFNRV